VRADVGNPRRVRDEVSASRVVRGPGASGREDDSLIDGARETQFGAGTEMEEGPATGSVFVTQRASMGAVPRPCER
jgi:hypothetical protein